MYTLGSLSRKIEVDPFMLFSDLEFKDLIVITQVDWRIL